MAGLLRKVPHNMLQVLNYSVTAVPDENYEFKEWTGSIISTENPLSIKVCQGERIIANFVLKNP